MTSSPRSTDRPVEGAHPLAAAPGAALAHALVESGIGAVVMLDGAGLVRLLNESARDLFPGLREADAMCAPRVPDWLARAQYEQLAFAQGAVGAREMAARRMPLPDGHVAYLLDDVTLELVWQRRWQEERDRAEFLARASARLLTTLNWHRSVQAVAELAGERMADAAVVIAGNGDRRLRLTSAVDGRLVDERLLTEPVGEVPGLADALAGFPSVPARCVAPAAVPGWLVPDGFGPLGSVVVTPMPGNGVPAGALVLLRRTRTPAFNEDEEVFSRVFAARAGAALSAAALYADRAETTAVLQRSLLPPVLRRSSGLDLAATYRASRATDLIGGDFYDVHPGSGPGGETFLVLGDVCGKGARAAVLTGKIRNTLSALRHLESDHHRLLELLNATLLEETDSRFATMVLAGATPLSHGDVALRLTAAGHPAPLIVRADGTVDEAPTRGTLIGALPEITTRTCHTVLRAGDTCLLYSDGVTEARGGPGGAELLGEERLRATLADCARLPVEAVIERVENLTTQWLGTREHDDIALLGIAAPRGTHLNTVNGTGRGHHTG
ncbi:PP2C family protein-serine/threonine phosphatase [Streptomyces sp. NPDC091272]|uniref:PP2C family protein-serine/threonine phosphatase n=1 Tax=Streptomyces sp. NPDC091272 TaxID=3365981 RepID=UPI0037F61FD1